jgi:hypothetical protein
LRFEDGGDVPDIPAARAQSRFSLKEIVAAIVVVGSAGTIITTAVSLLNGLSGVDQKVDGVRSEVSGVKTDLSKVQTKLDSLDITVRDMGRDLNAFRLEQATRSGQRTPALEPAEPRGQK